ncbi:J domain-containing protein [Anaerococcus murdochii]|uniref:J domain-containing protein n=1 Tax=Anaerococcus murdochii TaxID=411577 RepID=A0ABS7T0K5_9FIRM|nr:J domain-containing protein [Anaerococcus murdochii]MBZ2387310.1 J domain-containing protein [Anaerococcus murdochii]
MIIFLMVLGIIFAILSVGVVFIPYFALLIFGMDFVVVFLLPGAINNYFGNKVIPDNFLLNIIIVLIYLALTLYLLYKNKKAYFLVVSAVAFLMYASGLQEKTLPIWVMTIMYLAFILSRLTVAFGFKILSGRPPQNGSEAENDYFYNTDQNDTTHDGNSNNNIQNDISEFKDSFESACDMLNLSYNCSFADVKNNYRVFAKQYHPDVNNDDSSTRKLQKINEAYNFLTEDNIGIYQKLK